MSEQVVDLDPMIVLPPSFVIHFGQLSKGELNLEKFVKERLISVETGFEKLLNKKFQLRMNFSKTPIQNILLQSAKISFNELYPKTTVRKLWNDWK